MTNKTLHDLSDQELKKLYESNKELRSQAWEDAYNDAMFMQGEEFKELGADAFDYHDHYSSFYLTTPFKQGVKEPEAVANELERDYMTEENQVLYDELNRLTNEWESMDYDEQYSDKGDELYQAMTDACDKLADGITEQLREYENVSDEEVYDLFRQSAYDGYMSDWEVNEKGEVIETIYKTYK